MSMTDAQVPSNDAVNTVLGPISADELGVVAIHEALLSVVPGAQFAYDITIDRSEVFETLAAKLRAFREAGGGTIVDSTGMFHGRDVRLYEALSKATGVNIIASTGLGPEEFMGGYFLTPQTNPPTPWPAEKFEDLFAKEVTEGMVVPRVERRAASGLITAVADREGITPTELSLFKGSARAASATGIPLSIRFGADALAELEAVLEEGIAADRVIVSGLDRADVAGVALKVAARGAVVGIDHVGQNGGDFIDDAARADLVVELIAAGFARQIVLSSNATGVAKGLAPVDVPFGFVLTDFAPRLRAKGVSDEDITQILVENPRTLLTVRPAAAGAAKA